MKIALVVASICAGAQDPTTAVYFVNDTMLVPKESSGHATTFVAERIPFIDSGIISPSGSTIRVLGKSSADPAASRAIWELSRTGWTRKRALPSTARTAFVADNAWGYMEHNGPSWTLSVFVDESQTPVVVSLPEGTEAWDLAPPAWLVDERAALISTRVAGTWIAHNDGVMVNTKEASPWFISKVAIPSGRLTTVTDGLAPAISPDGHTLAFVRGAELWTRDLSSGTERAVVKAYFRTRGVEPFFFWGEDPGNLIVNFPWARGFLGLEEGWRCSKFDLLTGKARDIWRGPSPCVAAVDVDRRRQP